MAEQKSKRQLIEGICELCGATVTRRSMTQHLQGCVQNEQAERDATGKDGTAKARYFHITAQGQYQPQYWLHIEARADATLADLDDLLRQVWVECCGHLSVFHIDGRDYMSHAFERGDRNMKAKLATVLRSDTVMEYEYDFGTPTELVLKVVSEWEGLKGSIVVRELARNNAPRVACDECGKTATQVCGECMWEDRGRLCEDCVEKHKCGEDMLLPVVNSPRMGQCGYEG